MNNYDEILNPCLANLLGKRLGSNLIIPENPQIVGALGAALHAATGGKGAEKLGKFKQGKQN